MAGGLSLVFDRAMATASGACYCTQGLTLHNLHTIHWSLPWERCYLILVKKGMFEKERKQGP